MKTMVKYNPILFIFVYVVLLSIIFLVCDAFESDDESSKTYIVYMGSIPKGTSCYPTSHHLSMLQQVIDGSNAENHLVRSYNRSFSGFAAILNDQQREKLIGMRGVVSVFQCQNYHLKTTRSWDFLGFPQSIKRDQIVESGLVIGVIDSGIWPESESFTDKALGPIPKKWRGVCAGGGNFTCNKKIIGARSYGGEQSARDYAGHGTHTASTASGREVMGVSFYGLAKGTARGGVPSSRIAVYKVCNKDGTCNGNDILAAFDDAIADGVDIITISIGNQIALEFLKDPIAIGSFHAMEKGILTVQAAGNNGPIPSSVSSVAPWLFSIAATTIDRQIIDKLILGNGKTFIDERNLTQIPQLPSSVLVQSYTNSTKYPIAEILMREIFHDNNSPTVASFSSRGPNQLVLEIMKPDISAPGVNILAAYSPIAPLSGNINDKRHVKYNIKSGTSMACPHVAGVAAYVKSFHPDWSPASIKSAIMTTAKPVNGTYNDLAGEFAYGSGNVNPKQAIDPGLVYDITKEDYVQMLCNYGYDANKIKLISGENSSCHRASNRSFVKDINYPTLVIPVESQKSFNVKIHRTVTNVGSPNSRYMATVIPIENIKISVEPKILSFRSLNEIQSFVVTAVGGADSKRMVSSSSLVWSDGTHRVKSPIIVQRLS